MMAAEQERYVKIGSPKCAITTKMGKHYTMCLLNLVLAQKPAKNDRRQIAKARSITDVDLAESRHIKPHEKEKSKVERQRKWK
jgi:hypothetical protein